MLFHLREREKQSSCLPNVRAKEILRWLFSGRTRFLRRKSGRAYPRKARESERRGRFSSGRMQSQVFGQGPMGGESRPSDFHVHLPRKRRKRDLRQEREKTRSSYPKCSALFPKGACRFAHPPHSNRGIWSYLRIEAFLDVDGRRGEWWPMVWIRLGRFSKWSARFCDRGKEGKMPLRGHE